MYLDVNEWSTPEYLYAFRFGRNSCRTYTILAMSLMIQIDIFLIYHFNERKASAVIATLLR